MSSVVIGGVIRWLSSVVRLVCTNVYHNLILSLAGDKPPHWEIIFVFYIIAHRQTDRQTCWAGCVCVCVCIERERERERAKIVYTKLEYNEMVSQLKIGCRSVQLPSYFRSNKTDM